MISSSWEILWFIIIRLTNFRWYNRLLLVLSWSQDNTRRRRLYGRKLVILFYFNKVHEVSAVQSPSSCIVLWTGQHKKKAVVPPKAREPYYNKTNKENKFLDFCLNMAHQHLRSNKRGKYGTALSAKNVSWWYSKHKDWLSCEKKIWISVFVRSFKFFSRVNMVCI